MKKMGGPLYSLAIIYVSLLLAKLIDSPFLTLSLVLATIYMGLAIAWDFSSGLTGYINFGVPFFFGIGAFTTGYLSYTYHTYIPLTVVAGFAEGTLAGALFAVPTLRLRGPFFTLLSLLLPYISTSFVLSFWTVAGLPTIGYYGIARLAPSTFDELFLISVVDSAILIVFYFISKSRFGLVLRSIRDDEEAVSNLGVRTFRYKLMAFSLASGVMSSMGGIYASVSTFAGVDSFSLTFILFPMLIATIGSVKRILGCVPVSYLVVVLSQYLNLLIGSATLIVFTLLGIAIVIITQPRFLSSIFKQETRYE